MPAVPETFCARPWFGGDPALPPGGFPVRILSRRPAPAARQSPSAPVVLTLGRASTHPVASQGRRTSKEMGVVERERLCIVLLSGSFERVHYALCMASAAAALEQPVTLFVTLGALRALVAADATGRPGWMNLPGSEDAAASPGVGRRRAGCAQSRARRRRLRGAAARLHCPRGRVHGVRDGAAHAWPDARRPQIRGQARARRTGHAARARRPNRGAVTGSGHRFFINCRYPGPTCAGGPAELGEVPRSERAAQRRRPVPSPALLALEDVWRRRTRETIVPRRTSRT